MNWNKDNETTQSLEGCLIVPSRVGGEMNLKDIKVGDYLNQVRGVGPVENPLTKVVSIHYATIEHIHYPGDELPFNAQLDAFEPITLEQTALLLEHPTTQFHLKNKKLRGTHREAICEDRKEKHV